MSEGQTELFAGQPRRDLIRFGAFGYAGVDPSTKRCAIARIDEHGRRCVDTVSFPELGGSDQLAAVYSGVRGLWERIRDGIGLVVVEQPSGAKQNPQLVYAVGVTIAAIVAGSALPRAIAPTVETVPSSKWKKDVCGSGAIRKPKPADQRPYGVLLWARENGYAGSSWDEADAWAIAEWARRSTRLVRR